MSSFSSHKSDIRLLRSKDLLLLITSVTGLSAATVAACYSNGAGDACPATAPGNICTALSTQSTCFKPVEASGQLNLAGYDAPCAWLVGVQQRTGLCVYAQDARTFTSIRRCSEASGPACNVSPVDPVTD